MTVEEFCHKFLYHDEWISIYDKKQNFIAWSGWVADLDKAPPLAIEEIVEKIYAKVNVRPDKFGFDQEHEVELVFEIRMK